MNQVEVDLHCHSKYSDGSDWPWQLVFRAKRERRKAICLTDHEVYQGLPEFIERATIEGIDYIPAIELSCKHRGDLIHLLGYGIDYQNKILLNRMLKPNWRASDAWSQYFIKQVNHYGIGLPESKQRLKKMLNLPGPFIPILPIIVNIENRLGICWKSLKPKFFGNQSLFTTLLADPNLMTLFQAALTIKKLNGKMVLAHPGLLTYYSVRKYEAPENKLNRIIKILLDYDLIGLEAYNTEHSAGQCKYFTEAAKRYGLWVTAGSDYHGYFKPERDRIGMSGMTYKQFKKFKAFCLNE